MKPTLGRIIVLVGLAVLLFGIWGCEQTTTPGGNTPTTSAPSADRDNTAATSAAKVAPNFTLTTLEGNRTSLADLKGKPVVVVFWASWCHYCTQEAPALEALYEQYHPQGLEVLGVGTDDAAALAKTAKELKLTYPIGSNPEAAAAYGVSGIPHAFVISRQGEVVASLQGARGKDELEAEIKKVV